MSLVQLVLSPLYDLVKPVEGFMTGWLDQLIPDLLKSDLVKSVGGLRLTDQVSSHLSIQLIKSSKIVRSLK